MDYVSSIILDVVSDRFKNDPSYVEDVKDRLEKNTNKHDGLMYLFKLDRESKELFAQKIGVQPEDIESTLKVLSAV